MEALLLIGCVGLVFAGMYAILAFGYQSIEADRAKSENMQAARQALHEPRFFAKAMEAAPVGSAPFVPAHLIARLEQGLRLEYEGAALFASGPSKERICSGYGAYVDAVASDLERHIQRESAATMAFVAQPSVERLYSNES